jgi:hypothetical protein
MPTTMNRKGKEIPGQAGPLRITECWGSQILRQSAREGVRVGVLTVVYLYLLCFVLSVLCLCIVSFMYIYSYLFCLYCCKDYCHRVTTQLQ